MTVFTMRPTNLASQSVSMCKPLISGTAVAFNFFFLSVPGPTYLRNKINIWTLLTEILQYLRRKSKHNQICEKFLWFFLSIYLIYLNYLQNSDIFLCRQNVRIMYNENTKNFLVQLEQRKTIDIYITSWTNNYFITYSN